MERKKAIKESMKWVLKHWSVGRIEHSKKGYYANGINAYETWITQLLDESRHMYSEDQTHQRVTFENFHEFTEKNTYLANMHANAWMYDSYYDARSTALQFLNRIVDGYKGVVQELLLQLIKVYQRVEEMWYQGWLDFSFPYEIDWNNSRR